VISTLNVSEILWPVVFGAFVVMAAGAVAFMAAMSPSEPVVTDLSAFQDGDE
jgi:hypothetical protein